MYMYFVAYAHPSGFGHAMVSRATRVTTWEHITELGKDLSERNGFQVTLINFQLLSEDAA